MMDNFTENTEMEKNMSRGWIAISISMGTDGVL